MGMHKELCTKDTMNMLLNFLKVHLDIDSVQDDKGNSLSDIKRVDGKLVLTFDKFTDGCSSNSECISYDLFNYDTSNNNVIENPIDTFKLSTSATQEDIDSIRKDLNNSEWCRWLDVIVGTGAITPDDVCIHCTNDFLLCKSLHYGIYTLVTVNGVYTEPTELAMFLYLVSTGVKLSDPIMDVLSTTINYKSIFDGYTNLMSSSSTLYNSLKCITCGNVGDGKLVTLSDSIVKAKVYCYGCGNSWEAVVSKIHNE